VAFAHCPNCRKAFRYQVEAAAGPAWLKELARSVGKGEPALLLCPKCWFIPEVGDEVEITQRREESSNPSVGSIGRVVEVRNEMSAYPIFLVEGISVEGTPPWREQFMRWEIRASKAPLAGTLRFDLARNFDQSAE